MAVKIRTLRNTKVIAKKFIKEIKSLVSKKPNARIGIMWDDSLLSIYEDVIKSKKIKWNNTKIFSLVEYKDDLTVTFENTLFSEFVNKLNLERENYESLKERINDLKSISNLNDLYKIEDGIDLMIFPIDKRGNFLFNDFESKISYINYGNNGNEIVTPGIKSIMFAKKIICFAIQDGSEDMVEIVNSKNILSNEFVSLLNIHNNITLFTLYSIIKKKNINKNGYVNDKENIGDRVLSNSYEGDLSINDDDKKEIDPIDKFSVGLFKDNEEPIDLEEDTDDDEDEIEDENEIENIELSDVEQEIKDEDEIVDTEEDDGSAIDEPLNMNKTNLDDMIEEITNDDQEETLINNEEKNEELNNLNDNVDFENESDDQEETLYDIIKDEYESKISNDDLNENNDDDEIEEYRKLDDKFVEEEIETNIEEMEIESSLYKSDEQDEQIINKIKQMDELRDEEYYIPENYGDVDEEIKQLEIVKNQLEKELLELQQNNSQKNISTPNELNDTFDLNDDPVSIEADKYAPKNDVTIIYEDELNADYVNERIQPSDEKKSNSISFTNHQIDDNNSNDEIKIIDINPDKNPETNVYDNLLDKNRNNYIHVQGRNAEQIKRIIQIKEDALKTIELLIKNNELAIEQKRKELLLKQNNGFIKPLENKNDLYSNPSNNYVKITYIPGERPVPLLMVNDNPDNKIYEEILLEMIEKHKSNIGAKLFNESNKHLWNMGSYISYNESTNEIDLLAFSEFSNLIYILRYVNKELFYYVNKKNLNIFEKAMEGFESEFSIQK